MPGYHPDFDPDYDDFGDYEGPEFADPGGNSALRAATRNNPRNLPCPTCEQPNRLTPADVAQGYQCDPCADRDEMGGVELIPPTPEGYGHIRSLIECSITRHNELIADGEKLWERIDDEGDEFELDWRDHQLVTEALRAMVEVRRADVDKLTESVAEITAYLGDRP